jgi:hypothetical protein
MIMGWVSGGKATVLDLNSTHRSSVKDI